MKSAAGHIPHNFFITSGTKGYRSMAFTHISHAKGIAPAEKEKISFFNRNMPGNAVWICENKAREHGISKITSRFNNQMSCVREKTSRINNQMSHVKEKTSRDNNQMSRVKEKIPHDNNQMSHVKENTSRINNQMSRIKENTSRDNNQMSRVKEKISRDNNKMSCIKDQNFSPVLLKKQASRKPPSKNSAGML